MRRRDHIVQSAFLGPCLGFGPTVSSKKATSHLTYGYCENCWRTIRKNLDLWKPFRNAGIDVIADVRRVLNEDTEREDVAGSPRGLPKSYSNEPAEPALSYSSARRVEQREAAPEIETKRGGNAGRHVRRYLLFAALVFTVVLVGAGAAYFYRGRTTATNPDAKTSIAVLPLKPINAENRDDIFEIGIADSIIRKLDSMKRLVIRPLSAIRRYDDIELDSLAAGREQQADYVLASSYQLANGKIRVTSQLINVHNEKTEETYASEKDLTNLFAMQDSIADDIGNMLSARCHYFGHCGLKARYNQ